MNEPDGKGETRRSDADSALRLLLSVEHDIRTPLSAARALVRRGLELGPAREDLHRIGTMLDQLSLVVSTYSTYARLLTGSELPMHHPAAVGMVDIAAILRTATEKVERAPGPASRHRFLLRFTDNHDAVVDLDTALFELAVDRLLRHASAHADADTAIGVSLASAGHSVCLTIDWTGRPGEARELLADNPAGSAPASGQKPESVGFLVARGALRVLGGELSMDGEDDARVSLVVRLPTR